MINLQFCSIPVNYNDQIIQYYISCSMYTALYKLPCTFAPVIYHGIHFQSMITNHLYIQNNNRLPVFIYFGLASVNFGKHHNLTT